GVKPTMAPDTGDAPAHVTPTKGAAPDVVGLTPDVASPAHWERQAETSCQKPVAARRSSALVHRQSRSPGNRRHRHGKTRHHGIDLLISAFAVSRTAPTARSAVSSCR